MIRCIMTAAVMMLCLGGDATRGDDRPNVLFIAVDDLNDWVGVLGGHPQAKTPNIDRLASRGVVFANAHCAAPACEPSRAALFSGLRPFESGCYLNGHNWRHCIREGTTLNATFKSAGYFVAGMGKDYHLSTGGLRSVFASEWHEKPAIDSARYKNVKKYDGYHDEMTHDLADADLPDWHTADYIINQLGRGHEKPFFLSCGFIKPHLPWAVPRKYYEMFPLESIQLPPHLAGDLDDVPKAGRAMGVKLDHDGFVASGRWKAAVRSYLATIAYVDSCIGRVLDALDASEHRDNTIVVLWSDHGWQLGEKERWRKFSLWERATRVTMIWSGPGVSKGGRCERAVDLLSVYPTLCDLAGVSKPEHVRGPSLRPLLADPDAAWGHVALTTHGRGNHAVRNERYRYIRYADGSEELYDHASDPHEWKNLAGEASLAPIKAELSQHMPTDEAATPAAAIDKGPKHDD